MKKQTLFIMALLSNSVFAQSLPNYISVNNSNVPQISTSAQQAPQSTTAMPTPTGSSALSQGSQMDMGQVMSSLKTLNENAVNNFDVTAGLSAKDKAEYLNQMEKVKQLQDASKQMQDQMANDQTGQHDTANALKGVQPKIATSNKTTAKKIDKPIVKDIYMNNISGWNTSTIDEYTKQGKENLESRYTEFLNK